MKGPAIGHFGSGTDPISLFTLLLLLLFFFFLLGRRFSKKPKTVRLRGFKSNRVSSNWHYGTSPAAWLIDWLIDCNGMKFDRIVLQVNSHHWRNPISDMTSHFLYGGHDVRPPLAAACDSVRWLLAKRVSIQFVLVLSRCIGNWKHYIS